MNEVRTASVIVAGGTGERLGLAGGKQLAVVGGMPVLSWAVSAFDGVPGVGLIVVVCHPERIEEYRATAIEPLGLKTPVLLCAGGATRQESVAAGLAAVPSSFELISVHDGARPLVESRFVASILQRLEREPEAAGVIAGHPVTDTLKMVEGDRVATTPDRSLYWAVQTPQVFRAEALRAAYASAAAEGFLGTDDASLVERAGGRVLVLEGPRDNIKVTTAEDLVLAEAVLRDRQGRRS